MAFTPTGRVVGQPAKQQVLGIVIGYVHFRVVEEPVLFSCNLLLLPRLR